MKRISEILYSAVSLLLITILKLKAWKAVSVDSGLFNSNASSAHTTPQFLPHRPKIDSGQPMRTKEYVQKMVIFPYVDASNHYHDSSVMYVVLEEHHWLGRPVRALVKERD